MFTEVLMTRDFEGVFRQLPRQKQEIVTHKIKLLVQDQSHPSLKVHRLRRAGDNIRECYIDRGNRLLYEVQGPKIVLWGLGGHKIVDRAHQQSFDRSAHLLHWQLPVDQDAVPTVASAPSAPAYRDAQSYVYTQVTPQQTESVAQERNYFAHFREAQLRLLGVPEALVQAVRDASTMNEVFEISGLPDHAQARLMDIFTSPKMKTVLFDSSQLLYRTRLDRLEGYLEGRIKKLMLNLEGNQQQYVDLAHVPLLLLKGTAGCGNTTNGIYRAIRLAEEGRRVLVVTFNSTLASTTKTLLEELVGPLPKNLEVRTAHSMMTSLLGKRFNLAQNQQLPRQFLREALAEVSARETALVLKRDESFFLDEIQWVLKGLNLSSVEAYKAVKRYGRKTALGPVQREAVWKVYHAYQRRMDAAGIHEWADTAVLTLRLAQAGPLAQVFDDIIIDESQDFKPVELRAIQALAAPQSTIMVLGDAAQTLYSRGFSWVQAGISARGHTSILRVNYRNTSRIAEAASQLIAHNTLMRSSNEYVDPLWTQRDGYSPELLRSEHRYTQFDLVCEHILKLVGEQYRPADIAVLCPDNNSCKRCKDILIGKGLRAALTHDDDFNILEEQIKIMTIHSAKGLEFPVVFLTGLIEGELPRLSRKDGQDEEEARLDIERARMLCYVGITRAADRLFLVTVRGEESRFIRELYGKIEHR
ncbi:MAG: 3'-5' exonuclease [Ktedonobacteraceae bacterium]